MSKIKYKNIFHIILLFSFLNFYQQVFSGNTFSKPKGPPTEAPAPKVVFNAAVAIEGFEDILNDIVSNQAPALRAGPFFKGQVPLEEDESDFIIFYPYNYLLTRLPPPPPAPQTLNAPRSTIGEYYHLERIIAALNNQPRLREKPWRTRPILTEVIRTYNEDREEFARDLIDSLRAAGTGFNIRAAPVDHPISRLTAQLRRIDFKLFILNEILSTTK